MAGTDWAAVSKKWREREEASGASRSSPDSREKRYVTVAYPYPNSPQHIGHGRTYTVADVHARFLRMRGYNVLFPMAFHYTGTPILGMSKRIEDGDEALIADLRGLYGVPEDAIRTFADPVKIADYFRAEIRAGMVEMGYSIDWRREFTTIDEGYSKFIAWQARRQRELGLIVQGSHPVGWCPRDQNPVSQHDTQGDVEPEIVEYVIVRARLDDGTILPAATLRPETVFGVTNMWVNPDMQYVRLRTRGEEWLVSAECAAKMAHIDPASSVAGGGVAGAELVGRIAHIPGAGRDVPVLPARFVSGGVGTGAVMSVPAHAPYDYQALVDARSGAGAAADAAMRIEPVKIIDADGAGACPAGELVQGAGVSGQLDQRLDELTKQLYSSEFYGGTMAANTQELAGMRVADAKERAAAIIARAQGGASSVYEFSNAPVRCRCGAECVVHVLDKQWFLDYSSEPWKRDARRCLESMEVIPPEIRAEFDHVVGWLRERACARQHGLGTRLPWDDGWIIESLADSVIYMAYYTISHLIAGGRLDAGSLGDEFFDHVFLGRGSAADAAASCGIPEDAVREARAEFEYYYPVDARHSGRDLVPNHLSFFVFNHVALFPERHWPRSIVVNGSVLMHGKKMSKSMSNIIPLRDAAAKHGADSLRIAILSSAELLQDADFGFELVRSAERRLDSLLDSCKRGFDGNAEARGQEDEWLLERTRQAAAETTELVGRMRLREALQRFLSGLDADIAWHSRRALAKGRAPAKGREYAILRRVMMTRVALLAPFAPHAANEMWEALGCGGTATGSEWPAGDGEPDHALMQREELVRAAEADVLKIVGVTGLSPSRIVLYTASGQKAAAYRVILRAAVSGAAGMRDAMDALGADAEASAVRRDAAFVKKALADALSLPPAQRSARLDAGPLDEAAVLGAELPDLLRSRYAGARIDVCSESDPERHDPRGRASSARPFKPAIFIE